MCVCVCVCVSVCFGMGAVVEVSIFIRSFNDGCECKVWFSLILDLR